MPEIALTADLDARTVATRYLSSSTIIIIITTLTLIGEAHFIGTPPLLRRAIRRALLGILLWTTAAATAAETPQPSEI